MPSLSITAARITEPAVGALVWASGSQVWTGNNGTFTANASANDRKIHRPVVVAIACEFASSTRSKVRTPVSAWLRKASDRMPTSIRAEPNIV